jgi:hypothetical protein
MPFNICCDKFVTQEAHAAISRWSHPTFTGHLFAHHFFAKSDSGPIFLARTY